jgi:ABC-2 type transport system ATP-binding protein
MKLTIDGLCKTYPNGVQALKEVSLNINNGLFGLLGPNGAGKSTLMRTLATLQDADKGSIKLDEMDILVDKHEVRKILGYLPQEFGVYNNVSALELLDHIAVLKGITDKTKRKELIIRILHKTNLHEVSNKKLGTFSGGMKQRFGVAQALLGNPKIVIVDEPTAGLDPAERKRFLNMLSEISEQVIVILSTHIVDDVADICTQMAIIAKGQVKFVGIPSDAIMLLKDRIWKKNIARAEEKGFKDNYKVLSSKNNDGLIEIHVLSNDTLSGFEKVTPELEDVYFAAINNYLSVN